MSKHGDLPLRRKRELRTEASSKHEVVQEQTRIPQQERWSQVKHHQRGHGCTFAAVQKQEASRLCGIIPDEGH